MGCFWLEDGHTDGMRYVQREGGISRCIGDKRKSNGLQKNLKPVP